MPSSPCTAPSCSTYTDDGLHAKLAPLMATASELTSDLADMGKLLQVGAGCDCQGGVIARVAGCDCQSSVTQGALCAARRCAAGRLFSVCPGWLSALSPPRLIYCSSAFLPSQAASAEIYLLRRPHTFPTKQYQ